MNTRRNAVFTIFTLLLIGLVANAASHASTSFRLTIELRDGSRVIGTSRDSRLDFSSDTLGELKLPLEKIRSVESQTRSNLVKLTTTANDSLLVTFITEVIRVKTSYGTVNLPANLVKNIRVTAVGKVGRPQDGLIALWSVKDGMVVDSVSGNNGNLSNVSVTDGITGRAVLFAPDSFPYGTYCGVQIADQPAYALTKSLTIDAWARPRGNGYYILVRGDHRPGLDPYGLSSDGHGNYGFGICGGDNSSASVNAHIESGVWVHVAGVLDGDTGTMSFYTNGVLAAQTTTTVRPFGPLLPDQSPGIGIGNVNDGGNNFPFIGEIDEVGLYNRALSAEEVNAIYTEHAADAGARAELLPPRAGFRPQMRYGLPSFPTINSQ
jgi:hypothetical protein